MRRLIKILILLAVLYVGSYAAFRATHVERWSADQHDYLIFPKQFPALYYAFRPLIYLDGKFTGMRFHIGPHR